MAGDDGDGVHLSDLTGANEIGIAGAERPREGWVRLRLLTQPVARRLEGLDRLGKRLSEPIECFRLRDAAWEVKDLGPVSALLAS